MSFFGLNRAALNGGVSSIIAGAALIIASSGFAADGTRVLLSSASIVASSGAASGGVRIANGRSGFVSAAVVTAFPALLQLQTANIVAVSGLLATYTNAYAPITASLQGTGFITRPGAGVAAGVCTVVAEPLVIAGFASRIDIGSAVTADASVKLNGQTTVQRDGYARVAVVSTLAANGLKTALGYAAGNAVSSCTADSIKTHGGRAIFAGLASISAIASTDSGRCFIVSNCTATGFVTQFSGADIPVSFSSSAHQTVTTFGVAEAMAATSNLAADGRLALLADALMHIDSASAASGTINKMAAASAVTLCTFTAQWALLRESSARLEVASKMTAEAYTNAELPDPDERTLHRPFADRQMSRPFVDRTMRRSA